MRGIVIFSQKKTMEELTLSELNVLEKSSFIVCKMYENASRVYDGSITNGPSYEKFKKYNDFHAMVIAQMEKKIDEIIAKTNA